MNLRFLFRNTFIYMAAFFQILRDRIFSRAYIILQRDPEETSEEQKQESSESSAAENNADQNTECARGESETENRKEESDQEAELNSSKADKTSLRSSTMSPCNTKKKINNAKTNTTKGACSSLSESDLSSLYSDLKSSNDLKIRCKSALNLALCLAHDSPDIEFLDLIQALNDLDDSHNFPDLAVCHALLLCAFTKVSMSLEQLVMVEDCILCLTSSLKRRDIISNLKTYKTSVLLKDHNEVALKLCQECFNGTHLDLWDIDISTVCCCALYNLSVFVKQHDNELGANYRFKKSTLKYVLGMTGKSTQEIVSEFIGSEMQTCPSVSSHRVNQCLHVLEHALSVNPDLSSCESLQHESFSLHHCLTRLLGWSVSSVFPEKNCSPVDTDSYDYKFHLSTLVCILKILSVLTFNPHQFDSFTNVKGLMEKILICTLKAYFEAGNDNFDIQILCLEMLINLFIKNQKTFVLLCLKRFRISESEEILAVEALLKMLSDNLDKIKEVKKSTPYPQNCNEKKTDEVSVSRTDADQDATDENLSKKPRKELINEENSAKDSREFETKGTSNGNNVNNTSNSNENADNKSGKDNSAELDPVLLAASKDMELSTIVSFICVLIVFFMRTKQNFKDFILSKLTSQVLKEATEVSRKFLEFASITGGMPVTGILILTETIKKLQAVQRA